MDKKNCEHKLWRRTGEWDGKMQKDGSRTGGPMVECVDCGLEKNITYQEWAQMQKEGRVEIKRAGNRPGWFKPVKIIKK